MTNKSRIYLNGENLPNHNLKCRNCNINRPTSDYYVRSLKKENCTVKYIDTKCIFCTLNKDKNWYKSSKKVVDNYIEQYRSRVRRIEENKLLSNREKRRKYKSNRLKNDASFKLRQNVSRAVFGMLKRRGIRKNNSSIMDYLPYSFNELKLDLESKFEDWMTWKNWSIYNPDIWNDNDKSTWTWQIDHIIPHSTFKYSSMDSNLFLKCWSLDNLRPLSSKQNILDGANKTRHKINFNKEVFNIKLIETGEYKKCTKCLKSKDLAYFGARNRKRTDGTYRNCKQSACKLCINKYVKDKRANIIHT